MRRAIYSVRLRNMWSDKLFKMSKLGNVVNNESLDGWGSVHTPGSESGGDSSPAKMTLNENVASSSRVTIPKDGWKNTPYGISKYSAIGSERSTNYRRSVPDQRGPWDIPPGNFIRKPIRLTPASADAPVPTRHLAAHALIDGRYEILDDYLEHGRFGVQRCLVLDYITPTKTWVPNTCPIPDQLQIGSYLIKESKETDYPKPHFGINYHLSFE